MGTVATMEPTGELLKEFTENLPVIYEKGEPTAILLDIHIFEALLQRLDALEERELLGDPEVVAGLRKAREDHLTGRLISHTNLIKELGLEGEL